MSETINIRPPGNPLSLNDLTETNVMESKVAGITYGERVTVHTGYTGAGYRYDLASPMCMLGFSVIKGLDIIKVDSMTEGEAMELLTKYLDEIEKISSKQQIDQLKNLTIFKSEDCTICLTEKSDVVFLRCGHMCTCKGTCTNSIKICPLCRGDILARVDGTFIENLK